MDTEANPFFVWNCNFSAKEFTRFWFDFFQSFAYRTFRYKLKEERGERGLFEVTEKWLCRWTRLVGMSGWMFEIESESISTRIDEEHGTIMRKEITSKIIIS